MIMMLSVDEDEDEDERRGMLLFGWVVVGLL